MFAEVKTTGERNKFHFCSHLPEEMVGFGHHDRLFSLQRRTNKVFASQWLSRRERNLDRKEEPCHWETGKEDAVKCFRKH